MSPAAPDEATGAPFRGFSPVAGDEVWAKNVGVNPANSRQAATLHRMCALDTGLTLCCSVRQPPHGIQGGGKPVQDPETAASKGNATMVTIRDVAKESGFSSTTVSIVL